MNREEKINLLVGLAVTLVLAVVIFVVFSTENNNNASARYILISSIPTEKTLRVGDAVLMDGKKVGVVQSVSQDISAGAVAVRMKVARDAFEAVGEDSVAWINASDSSGNEAAVVIKKGSMLAKSHRFVKIKPVRGVLPPTMKIKK